MAYPSAPLRSGQRMHDMMPVAEHDEMSRQLFLQSFLQDIGVHREPGNQTVWTKSVQPKFRKEHGREPKNSAEMRKAMLQDPYVQVWSSLKRIAKEMQYESVGPMVERQLPDLIAKARKYRDSNRKLGSLMLDPSVQAPRYNSEIAIHAKPGGYHTDLTEDDVFAGAEFDRTLYMLQWGGYGEWCDNMGESLADWAKANLPDLKPRKILDMGCTIGSSTLPWVDAYPNADVHAIDVAAPCLRYGHARAEALGKKVHFSQQNAEGTKFEDGSFDLIVSHILLHELSLKAIHKIFAECHRLLKPGGVMLHMDLPPKKDLSAVGHFGYDWNTHYQAEPFITTLTELDRAAVAVKGGFDPKNTFETYVPSTVPGRTNEKRHMFGARK